MIINVGNGKLSTVPQVKDSFFYYIHHFYIVIGSICFSTTYIFFKIIKINYNFVYSCPAKDFYGLPTLTHVLLNLFFLECLAKHHQYLYETSNEGKNNEVLETARDTVVRRWGVARVEG